MVPTLAPLALSAILIASIQVKDSAELERALRRVHPGDVIELAPGSYQASLGRLTGVAVHGAGPELTAITSPEGSDGALAEGAVELSDLALRAGLSRCALKVRDGRTRLKNVFLGGDSCGLFVDGGTVEAERVDLRGGLYGLLMQDGQVSIDEGSARGTAAGIGLLHGSLVLRRMVIVGPSQEAGISVAAGEVELDTVIIARPGPTGIAVARRGRVTGRNVTIMGALEQMGFSGDCVQSIGGEVRLTSSELLKCGGAALEASRATITLDGVDAQGGVAGCLALVDGARADLQGNRCTGKGPGLVLASGSTAQLRMNRWLVDPVLWVECQSGARAKLLYGEKVREPCHAPADR